MKPTDIKIKYQILSTYEFKDGTKEVKELEAGVQLFTGKKVDTDAMKYLKALSKRKNDLEKLHQFTGQVISIKVVINEPDQVVIPEPVPVIIAAPEPVDLTTEIMAEAYPVHTTEAEAQIIQLNPQPTVPAPVAPAQTKWQIAL